VITCFQLLRPPCCVLHLFSHCAIGHLIHVGALSNALWHHIAMGANVCTSFACLYPVRDFGTPYHAIVDHVLRIWLSACRKSLHVLEAHLTSASCIVRDCRNTLGEAGLHMAKAICHEEGEGLHNFHKRCFVLGMCPSTIVDICVGVC